MARRFERLKARLDRLGHGPTETGVIGDQDRLRAFVMLGLAEKIDGDPVGVVVGIGDHQDLGRPRDHVDTHLAEDPALGRRHKGVAGAGDLVHGRDGLGPVGHGRDRLRASDAIYLVDARKPRGQQDQRIGHAIRRGRAESTSRSTPATCAGIAFISTEDG